MPGCNIDYTPLLIINWFLCNFRDLFFTDFRTLLEETDKAYVCCLADYLRRILSTHMLVRVERPRGSKRFVLGYVKCDWVFSFAVRLKKMRVRLSRVWPSLLTKWEKGENKPLRLACVGETNYERALAMHSDTRECGVLLPPLLAALKAKDEDAAEALLDGGDDPNEVDLNGGYNALHMAAWKDCRIPLFHRILGRIKDVNAVTTDWRGFTALMWAARDNHPHILLSLMNHPKIDVNVQDRCNYTALHLAVFNNHPAIIPRLLFNVWDDSRVADTTLKDASQNSPLSIAIACGHLECAVILQDYEAAEPSSSKKFRRRY